LNKKIRGERGDLNPTTGATGQKQHIQVWILSPQGGQLAVARLSVTTTESVSNPIA